VTRVGTWNLGAFAAAVVASTAVAWLPQRAPLAAAAASSAGPAPLVDHAGVEAPRRDYRRIVSGTTIADAMLLAMAEPERVAAFTAYSSQHGPHRYRYDGKPVLANLHDLEAVLALRPDLVLVAGPPDARVASRLRDAGVVVYDLGDMRGMSTLLPNIHEVAELLGHPERGERFARAVQEEMHGVSAAPAEGRPRALYLASYGGKLLGGARGTSYHDVLLAAGFADAASAYRDWPEYSAEQVLAIDPDVIVTNTGMRARICEHAGLGTLRACAADDGVVEMEDGLLGSPGPYMVEAARDLRTKGRRP
jgi:iron complex transport system substrate-binding protein